MDDRVFTMRDPELRYTPAQIMTILCLAEEQGYPLDAGSYLESMTIRQLDGLLHGRTDA